MGIFNANRRHWHQLDLLEGTLTKSAYLAGERLTLADLYLAPILYHVGLTAEGKAALAGKPAVGGWYGRMAARPSFAATAPELPPSRAAA